MPYSLTCPLIPLFFYLFTPQTLGKHPGQTAAAMGHWVPGVKGQVLHSRVTSPGEESGGHLLEWTCGWQRQGSQGKDMLQAFLLRRYCLGSFSLLCPGVCSKDRCTSLCLEGSQVAWVALVLRVVYGLRFPTADTLLEKARLSSTQNIRDCGGFQGSSLSSYQSSLPH